MAVLGRSWGLCWRSWAALGAFVGGPGPSWAEKWPWPEREGDLAPSWAEKWPKPERECDPQRVGPPEEAKRPTNFYLDVYTYMYVYMLSFSKYIRRKNKYQDQAVRGARGARALLGPAAARLWATFLGLGRFSH